MRPLYLTAADSEGPEVKTPTLLARCASKCLVHVNTGCLYIFLSGCRLETLLDEKLSLVDKAGAAKKGFATTQIRTNAYRQVRYLFMGEERRGEFELLSVQK